ncbi:MAG TPA: CHRD domain-containing protein [Gaiellaceae bacterium]|nr:CHRD domain-containing protein [Gaiellaceae bacterium]
MAIFAIAAIVQAAPAAKPTKTTICHRTLSAKKPYVKITVTKSVLKGHIAHPGDIIPAPPGGCPRVVLTATKGGVKLSATLTGAAEFPGPGDPDGAGTAMLRLRVGQGQVCHMLTASNIMLPATGAHIHRGAAGVAGPIVVTLITPDADGSVAGCVAAPRALVKEILMNPAGFYVNVHTTDYPAGAIRGQLG